jgi:hypothetical protein
MVEHSPKIDDRVSIVRRYDNESAHAYCIVLMMVRPKRSDIVTFDP